MANKYRVTVPELVTDFDPQARIETTHSVNTVLWRGDDLPDDRVIGVLLEGQVEQRSGRRDGTDMTAHSHGHHLFIEQRKHILLGWIVVDTVSIPGA